jgi:xanthine dehydrogenase YagS FAD-binding subunit
MSLQVQGDIIASARVVFGGIAGRPLREKTVEGLLAGRTLGSGLADDVVAPALANAAPLKYNAMKIEMAKGLLASGLAALSA